MVFPGAHTNIQYNQITNLSEPLVHGAAKQGENRRKKTKVY